jgi:hypothetical protein
MGAFMIVLVKNVMKPVQWVLSLRDMQVNQLLHPPS